MDTVGRGGRWPKKWKDCGRSVGDEDLTDRRKRRLCASGGRGPSGTANLLRVLVSGRKKWRGPAEIGSRPGLASWIETNWPKKEKRRGRQEISEERSIRRFLFFSRRTSFSVVSRKFISIYEIDFSVERQAFNLLYL